MDKNDICYLFLILFQNDKKGHKNQNFLLNAKIPQ